MDIPIICLLLDSVVVLFSMIVKSFLPFKETGATWDDLLKRYPKLLDNYSSRKAVLDLALLVAGLIGSLVLLYLSQKYNSQVYSVIFLLVGIAFVYDGLMALSSAVYGIGLRNYVRYYYDEEKKYTWVAKSQTIISALISTVIAYLLWLLLF